MLELQKEQRSEYIKKVTAMATRIGYTVSTPLISVFDNDVHR